MLKKHENPAALAGADRADVTKLAGKNDHRYDIGTTVDLQVRRVLTRYAVSMPLAIVIAEHAFSSGTAA